MIALGVINLPLTLPTDFAVVNLQQVLLIHVCKRTTGIHVTERSWDCKPKFGVTNWSWGCKPITGFDDNIALVNLQPVVLY